MYLPNYHGGSIVNLMSSIKSAFGGVSDYQKLVCLDNDILLTKKNVILILIDGLGYEFLIKHGKGTFLESNLRGKITSVFPTTTATALTALTTGVPAQQHALTGWFMYLKELGMVTITLPFLVRKGRINLSNYGIKFGDIVGRTNFFDECDADSFVIRPRDHVNAESMIAISKGAQRMAYSSLNGLFRQIKKVVKNQSSKRKFINAYWSELDEICHLHGTNSLLAKNHLEVLDKQLQRLVKLIRGTNTTVIITADHGLIDTKQRDKIIFVQDHPFFANTLAVPLCGESRAAYCYVRPSHVKEFEQYVKTHFSKFCHLYKSEELLKKNYFGLFEPDKRLQDRIGDYVLIMKENYIIKDQLLGEQRSVPAANHGGLSKEELFVPLVVIESG